MYGIETDLLRFTSLQLIPNYLILSDKNYKRKSKMYESHFKIRIFYEDGLNIINFQTSDPIKVEVVHGKNSTTLELEEFKQRINNELSK